MTSSILFLNGNPLFFFLDSDSPFNCLNDKFLRKKIIKLEKINFITNKNKSKNQGGKSNSQKFPIILRNLEKCPECFQSNVTVNFIRMCYLFYKTFSKMIHLTKTQRIEIFILIGCWDKTKTGGISS
jgi:hypothetical protein